MNKKNISFDAVVKGSRVLTSEQKEELLAGAALPAAYQKKLVSYLSTFDKHSKAREAYLRDKLEKLYTEFMSQLDSEELDEETKKELLEKAKKQMDAFFPKNKGI